MGSPDMPGLVVDSNMHVLNTHCHCAEDEEGLEDGDVDSGSDAELAAVLEHASGLVGSKAGPGAGKKRRPQAADELDGR